jgi:hypothetical protein
MGRVLVLRKIFRGAYFIRLARFTDVEAFFSLSLAKFYNIVLPFRWYARSLGKRHSEGLFKPETKDVRRLIQLRRSVRRVARHLPWHTKCLDQAMAVQWMLSRRRLTTTMYFGVRKSEEMGKFIDAHAWVRCGDVYVIGYQPDIEYTVVGSYVK